MEWCYPFGISCCPHMRLLAVTQIWLKGLCGLNFTSFVNYYVWTIQNSTRGNCYTSHYITLNVTIRKWKRNRSYKNTFNRPMITPLIPIHFHLTFQMILFDFWMRVYKVRKFQATCDGLFETEIKSYDILFWDLVLPTKCCLILICWIL